MAARRKKPKTPNTNAAFLAALAKLHAKMDAGFAEVGRRFDRVEGDVGVMRQDIGELRQDVAEIRSDVAVLKQDVAVLKGDVAVLKEDMTLVKAAALQHTRELSALRTSVSTKVDREEVEPMVESVIARHSG